MSDAAARLSGHSWIRHELIRVAPPLWRQVLSSRPDLEALPMLRDWADRGWPVIVRRRAVDEGPDSVPVGVPLPPTANKARIALTLPRTAALQRSSLPPLSAVKHTADRAWWRTIDALVALGARLGVTPASFGSLFWQHTTGLAYLSCQSDLDVLWHVHRGCNPGSLLAGIASVERLAPMRIDGEIVFMDGGAVNWRELRAVLDGEPSGTVLVKSIDRVRLASISQLPNLRSVA